jgi:hypothetical protein
MATILDKDITRETTVKVDNREIQITLTDKQTISMKLKGLKSGEVEISIEDLFKQLKGDTTSTVEKDEEVEENPKYTGGIDLSSYKGDERFLISLHDIRHAVNVKPIDMSTKVIFENFLVELINDRKDRKNKK